MPHEEFRVSDYVFARKQFRDLPADTVSYEDLPGGKSFGVESGALYPLTLHSEQISYLKTLTLARQNFLYDCTSNSKAYVEAAIRTVANDPTAVTLTYDVRGYQQINNLYLTLNDELLFNPLGENPERFIAFAQNRFRVKSTDGFVEIDTPAPSLRSVTGYYQNSSFACPESCFC